MIIGQGTEERRLKWLAGPTVDFLGWCDQVTIRYHLRRCRALIFPGREDFGIVPLEAQACGAPVVAWGVDGVLETLLPASFEKPGTAVLYDAPTVDALVAALLRAESGMMRFSAALARRQAERFGETRFIKELVAVVEQTVAEHRAETGGRRDAAARFRATAA